ncbi:MAG: DedA family protein [Chlamydiae bacterium]|nr:DedA family protein [Chlamydiota bacterium]
MDSLVEFIRDHIHLAHWYIFGAIVLAGMNFPISIDLMMIISASLAAIFPEKTAYLFFAVFFGSIFSAWVSYWIGRKFGPKICRLPFFSRILNEEKTEMVKNFYVKYGFCALIIGRFIPFGVRNCIFMSSGLTQMPFGQFAMRDMIACTIWAGSCFPLFYLLGKNFDLLYNQFKTWNYFLFGAFTIVVIGVIWYKKRKKRVR